MNKKEGEKEVKRRIRKERERRKGGKG